ncbi:hypothetical protein RJT34_11738 [Clitoria ternatea]|uniref:CCT domain-containing protein n=1 Tax=Clitoria ternatea TaxID=43366 RepID=A0AAN9PKR9_CLITE
MAGRKHLPSSLTRLDESRIATRLPHSSSSAAVRALPVAALEDRIDTRHREIQTLLVDNQRLAATHVALKQDLAATQEELRHLSAAAAEVKAERDAEVREIYEKSLRVDAEARAVAAMTSDLDRVRVDAQELAASRKELASQLQSIEGDLTRARTESRFLPAIKADIEAMRLEIQRGRNAIEFEKKTHASNLEHKRAMDNNMIIMAREVEKLRAELANAEKRARAAMAAAANPNPGYPSNYDNPEVGYGGIAYPPDSYSNHQIQAGVDAHSQYTSGATLRHPYDLQHTQSEVEEKKTRDKMGCTSILRSPKKEEQKVPDANHPPYDHQDFNILDELEGVFNSENQQQKLLLPPQKSSGVHLHWDFMEWNEFPPIGEEAEDENNNEVKEEVSSENRSKCFFDEEPQHIKRENNIVGFWEVDDEKMVALNLNLNYQDVLDAWSDRGSLWADDCSLSLASNNGYYMGEVPILEEERARREASVLRYKEKRQNRLFSKKIRYQVRKLNADKRPRIKGRFVKRR